LQKSPVTDKHLGVTTRGYDIHSFSELRAKAKEEFEERYRKAKRNKAIKLPQFKIDDEIVITSSYFNKTKVYTLVKVVDFDVQRYDTFIYFGVILKTTDPEQKHRIGRLLQFAETVHYFGYSYANIEAKDVIWEIKK